MSTNTSTKSKCEAICDRKVQCDVMNQSLVNKNECQTKCEASYGPKTLWSCLEQNQSAPNEKNKGQCVQDYMKCYKNAQ